MAAAPAKVVEIATKAASLIGSGLYGVDLKETDRGVFVVEINDNPNIDAGVEDAVLKDELYRTILGSLVRRLERRSQPGKGRNGHPLQTSPSAPGEGATDDTGALDYPLFPRAARSRAVR